MDMNSGPQSFDTNKGGVTPTSLDTKAEAARENSSSSFVLKEKNGDVTKFTNGLSGDDIPAKKMTYTKLSSEDVKKSGGIETANHFYRTHDGKGDIPQGSTFSNENQPDRR